jgi:hypothetical protein
MSEHELNMDQWNGEDFTDDLECTMCGGEGSFFGEDLPTYDFFWHRPDRLYPCPSCNGSGARKDMTIC